jgi:PAT family beta-lactamase induction signal transducer AmpG
VFVMVATIPSFLACWFAPFHHDDGSAGDDAGATLLREEPGAAARERVPE